MNSIAYEFSNSMFGYVMTMMMLLTVMMMMTLMMMTMTASR